MRRALVVGIDAYRDRPLRGCVADATAVAARLARNEDAKLNFEVRLLTSADIVVTSAALNLAVEELFQGDAETVLLYFAGHGILSRETNAGHLVAQDGAKGGWGMALTDILGLANNAYPHIRSSVIILDSCHSGFVGEIAALGRDNVSTIGTGVTILTSTHRDGKASESDSQGVFTEILVDGLDGAAADILGRVTPAALYSLIDQTLGPWGMKQRPIYKANVQTFVTLRQVEPRVPPGFLRELPALFPNATDHFALDPSFERRRDGMPPEVVAIPVDPENARVFDGLQKCNRNGLIVPVGAKHMFDAAIESKACRLTAIGAHYRKLAELKQI